MVSMFLFCLKVFFSNWKTFTVLGFFSLILVTLNFTSSDFVSFPFQISESKFLVTETQKLSG